MIRMLDVFISLTALILLSPLVLLIMIVGYFDTGSPIFRQERVGRGMRPFTMIKFRTMKNDAPSVASHLVDVNYITKFGSFLRNTKLDEIPQFWNVLKGEMSIVGPRPCLFNQKNLLQERLTRGVFEVRPGITGLAQIKNVDMSTPETLAETDREMISNLNISTYFYFVVSTVVGRGLGDAARF